MTIVVTRLTLCFAARIDGVDITRPVDDPIWAEIRAAFEEHSVLVFRGQALDDEPQVALSRRFGGLEVTRSINLAAGTPFARPSNLDIRTGESGMEALTWRRRRPRRAGGARPCSTLCG